MRPHYQRSLAALEPFSLIQTGFQITQLQSMTVSLQEEHVTGTCLTEEMLALQFDLPGASTLNSQMKPRRLKFK